jgi:hypothetical protein
MGNYPSGHQVGPTAAPTAQVALNTRISTSDQNCGSQLGELQH